MIPTEKRERQQMIEYMLKALITDDQEDKLTTWEKNFVESVSNQFDDKGNLSDKQCEVLERIYNKVN